MTLNWISIGAFAAALAVIAGAFGAHALADRLDAHHLTLWETAARYLMYGALSLVLLGLAARGSGGGAPGGYGVAGWSLALGTLVFSGTVASLALGGPRWLGAVTPLGGLLMIAGLAFFGWAASR